MEDKDADEVVGSGFEKDGRSCDSESGKFKHHFDEMLCNSRVFAASRLSPKLGIEFESEEDAYEFYLKYSKAVGFRIRKHKSYNDKLGKLIGRTFCCSAQGKKAPDKRDRCVREPRPETRYDCGAKMKIKRAGKKFEVTEFVEDHSHYIRSTGNISSSAAMTNDVWILPKVSDDLVARQVDGSDNLGFIPEGFANYLRSKRTRDMNKGDAGGVLECMQKMQFEDPSFFYAIQVDEDDLITNILWSDAKMRNDYSKFGDVVCFDTTFRNNSEGRPLALFVGVNHHKQMVIFGVALLYDETYLTFDWLFDTFTRAMLEKKPKTIVTDQDAAIAHALASKWPESHHRLSIGHICQNAEIHLSGVVSRFKEFLRDFSSCVYDYEEEKEFFISWEKMLQKYDLAENAWLKHIYAIKEKWALVYGRQVFCADIAATQRSDSMNSVVKRYASYQHNFLQFFSHFQRLIDNRRYDELKDDLKANISTPALAVPCKILKHGVSIYTPAVFKCFQDQWDQSHDSEFHVCEEVGNIQKYKICPFGKRFSHYVTYDSSNGEIYCSCRNFEFAGILCSHVLKVFTLINIFEIPSQYVMKRWSRKAKMGYLGAKSSTIRENELDNNILSSLRYKELSALTIQLVTKAAERGDASKIVKAYLHNILVTVDELLQGKEVDIGGKPVSKGEEVAVEREPVSKGEEVTQCSNFCAIPFYHNDNDFAEENGNKGIMMKEKPTSGKRLNGGLGKAAESKKKKFGGDYPTISNMNLSIPNLPSDLQNLGKCSESTSNELILPHTVQPMSSSRVSTDTTSLAHNQVISLESSFQAQPSPFLSYGNPESHPYNEHNLMVTPDFGFGGFSVSTCNKSRSTTVACSERRLSANSCNDRCGCAFPCLNDVWCICRRKKTVK